MTPLDDATNELNAAFAEAEHALKDMRLGVTAHVALDDEHDLHFKKRGKVWSLVVVSRTDSDAEALLCNASRALRVVAATKLVDLRTAALAAADRNLVMVEEALRAVRAFVEDTRLNFQGCSDD